MKQEDVEAVLDNKPNADFFKDSGLSVIVSGPGFPELNLEKEISDSNGLYVGAVEIPSSEFLPEDKFHIRHDPYDFNSLPQHPNHAQIFCDKKPGKRVALQKSCKLVKSVHGQDKSEETSGTEVDQAILKLD